MKGPTVLLCCFALVAAPMVARAQSGAVVSVVTVKAKGDDSAYLQKLRAAAPIVMRLGATNYRVFRAAFAGNGAGSIISVAEYKDWAAFAEARAKRGTDAEFQKWYKDLIASDVSELVSMSILEELPLEP